MEDEIGGDAAGASVGEGVGDDLVGVREGTSEEAAGARSPGVFNVEVSEAVDVECAWHGDGEPIGANKRVPPRHAV